MLNRLPKSAGFTLMEIVVAVSIFAIMSTMMFPALIQYFDITDRLKDKGEKIAELQRLFVFLENDLRYVVYQEIRDPFDGQAFAQSFTLDTDDGELIKFVALYPDAAANAAVSQLVAWQLDDDKLQRKTWFTPSFYADEEPRVATIMQGVRAIELQVADSEEDGLVWTADWDDKESIPKAVEWLVTLDDDTQYRRVFEIPPQEKEAIATPPAGAGGQQAGDGDGGTNTTNGGSDVGVEGARPLNEQGEQRAQDGQAQ